MNAISQKAIEFIKAHKIELIKKFAGEEYPSLSDGRIPISVFMAGSPGAGKTEFSKGLVSEFREKPVRLDADDIRAFIPEYTGKNSDLIQAAASVGVEKIFDFVLKDRKNVIVDGTFVNKAKSMSNIERSLKKGRKVEIYYIYQEPILAWEFTKAREEIEGRNIPKDAFIKAFLLAKQNVIEAKIFFGSQIILNVVVKDFDALKHRIFLNAESIDHVQKNEYDEIQLAKLLNPS